MNRYLKLVHFEFARIQKIFYALLAIILVSQTAGVLVIANMYVSQQGLIETKRGAHIDPINLIDIARTPWFVGPIALCIVAVIFYIFLIWYRDWFGKNTLIYRLLMLPTARMNVFWAKISTILIITFGFVAFQLLLLPMENTILKWIVPADLRVDMGAGAIVRSFEPFNTLIPDHIMPFILHYGAGALAVVVVFTAILFERSYRLKGIFLGAGFIAAAIVVFMAPLFLQGSLFNGFFYPEELFAFMVFTSLIVLLGALWMSNMLLRKKIRV